MQPRQAETMMRNSFNTTMKYQNKLWTKILLERMVMKNIGTNEVVLFAKNQAKNSKVRKMQVFKETVTENMKMQ